MAYPNTLPSRVPRHQPAPVQVPLDVFQAIGRSKGLLLVCVAVSLALGGVYMGLFPRTCVVTARVLVRSQGMPIDPEREPKTSASFLATQAEIIHSPTVLERALKSLNLPPRRDGKDLRVEILKRLTVKPLGGTEILSILYKAPQTDRPVETVEAMIASYREYLREAEQGSQLASLSIMTDYEKGLRQELDSLGERYLELHRANASLLQDRESAALQQARMVEVTQQLRQARLRRADIESRLLPSARPALLAQAKDQEQQWEEEYRRESQRARATDDDVIREQQVLASIQRLQAMYDSVVTQVRQLKLADQALATGRLRVAVSILEAPTSSPPQLFPPPLILLPGCALLGLAAGVGFVVLREQIAARVQSLQQVQEALGLSVVAGIPAIEAAADPAQGALLACRQVCQTPDSAVAHAFRALRTRLIHRMPAEGGWILQCISPNDGEGKTTVAANLACSFAQLGKRVVLVDADLRRGRQHGVFEVPLERGLSLVVYEGLPLDKALSRSPLAQVDVLSRGPDVGSPAELLAQPAFDEVLAQLRQRYEVVLVDGPPLFAESGSLILATKVDAVLLCLRLGRSSLEEGERACELLENLDKAPWGAVVSQIPAGRYGAYYASYHATLETEERQGPADPVARNGRDQLEATVGVAGQGEEVEDALRAR